MQAGGRVSWAWLLMALFPMLGGCATVYKASGVDGVSANELAILEVDKPVRGGYVIMSVDGAWRGMGLLKVFEFPPGVHSIKVGVNSYPYTSVGVTKWFRAEAGHTYYVSLSMDTNAKRWNYQIIDKGTDIAVDRASAFAG
jgi:hypothetical protein